MIEQQTTVYFFICVLFTSSYNGRPKIFLGTWEKMVKYERLRYYFCCSVVQQRYSKNFKRYQVLKINEGCYLDIIFIFLHNLTEMWTFQKYNFSFNMAIWEPKIWELSIYMRSIPWDHINYKKYTHPMPKCELWKIPTENYNFCSFMQKNTVIYEPLLFSVGFFSNLHLGVGYRYSLWI